MSSIQKRQLKTGPSWRVRYIDPDGQEKSKSFRRKADAEKFQTSIDHDVLTGAYVDPAAGKQTLRDYLEHWRTTQPHRPRTARGTKHRFEKMVYPYIGHLPIGNLKPSTIRTWQTNLAEHPYGANTIKVVRGQLSGALNDAVLDRLLARNPCDGVKAPPKTHKQVIPRTVAQVRAGHATLTGHDRLDRFAAVIPTVAGTGPRPSELFGLTRDRINFLRRTMRIDRQLVGITPDGEPEFGPPKTRKSYRTIPMPKMVVDALAAHLAAYPAEPDQLVFRRADGRPVGPEFWSDVWALPQAAMGLDPGEGLHQLRHFYASVLIADGRSVKEVQERLGHSSAQITLDVYAHLFPDTEDGTRSAVDNAFSTDESGATPKGDAASSEL